MMTLFSGVVNVPGPFESTRHLSAGDIFMWILAIMGLLVIAALSVLAARATEDFGGIAVFCAVMLFAVYGLILTSMFSRFHSDFPFTLVTVALALLMMVALYKMNAPWLPYAFVIGAHLLVLFQTLLIDRTIAPTLSDIFALVT